MKSSKPVETMYPLSSSQQGMLFETLAAPESGIHIEQTAFHLHGNLDIRAFERSWHQIVGRHPIFRTAFAWKDLEEPIQVVFKQVRVPVDQNDWQNFPTSQQDEKTEAYLKSDRRRGFNLNKMPLIRVALFRLNEDTYQCILTHHHILMDGWCLPIIFQEFTEYYAGFVRGEKVQLKPVRPYRDYIKWIKSQDLSTAEIFWCNALKKFKKPTYLGTPTEPQNLKTGEEYAKLSCLLSASETATAEFLARSHKISLNLLLQGIWALLLSRYSGERDVIFGATVSGRPPELTGVESMIGLFINTIPMRFDVHPKSSFWSWLNDIRILQSEQRPYEYYSAGQIHQWSEVPDSLPLYDSILVFENYPATEAMSSLSKVDMDMTWLRSEGAQTNYPITLLVIPGPTLEIQFVFNLRHFDPSEIARFPEHFSDMLKCVISNPDQHSSAIMDTIPTDHIPKFLFMQREYENYVAPRDTLELKLLQIWEAVLEVHPIGIRDNFFSVGGHSMIVVRTISQIHKALGTEITLNEFFLHPTIEDMAKMIRLKGSSQDKEFKPATPLVCLQPHGDNLPLFLVHILTGQVFCYINLSQQLGKKQPFYALQAPEADPNNTSSPACVEDMAKEYVKAICKHRPEGPYIIGGYSGGGLIAYEMARQLQEQGKQVPLLILIDTYAIQGKKLDIPDEGDTANTDNELMSFMMFMHVLTAFTDTDLFALYDKVRGIKLDKGAQSILEDFHQEMSAQERMLIIWECLRQGGSLKTNSDINDMHHIFMHFYKIFIALFSKNETAYQKELRYFWDYVQKVVILASGISIGNLDYLFKIMSASLDAFSNYAIRPYSGRVILFRAIDEYSTALRLGATMGWDQYVSGPIDVFEIQDVNHATLLTPPFVKIVAEKLTHCLESKSSGKDESNLGSPDSLFTCGRD